MSALGEGGEMAEDMGGPGARTDWIVARFNTNSMSILSFMSFILTMPILMSIIMITMMPTASHTSSITSSSMWVSAAKKTRCASS
ncbi:hypothetical protein EON65_35710 [archaeon]|nr:MAG: hypothetical protein EON65_35710 [archaeon]